MADLFDLSNVEAAKMEAEVEARRQEMCTLVKLAGIRPLTSGEALRLLRLIDLTEYDGIERHTATH
jgi:hypothetical protein